MRRLVINGMSLGFGIALGMLVMALARPEQRRVRPCGQTTFHHAAPRLPVSSPR